MSREYREIRTAHAYVEAVVKVRVRGRVDLDLFEAEEFFHDMLSIGEYEVVDYGNEFVELTDEDVEIDEYQYD